MQTKNSLLKKQRVMRYFLDAAVEIAEESGIEGITIRAVADRAGYNSATLYNYFENREQIIAYAVLSSVAEYLGAVPGIFSRIREDTFNCYVDYWRTWCSYAFSKPNTYAYMFASDRETMDQIQSQMEEYLRVFPDTFPEDFDEDYLKIHFAHTQLEYDMQTIAPFVRYKLFTEEAAKDILEFGMILFDGVIHQVMILKEKTPEEYVELFLKYFIPFLKTHCNPSFIPE